MRREQERWNRFERYDTVIVGGGQAGLSVGYHLKKEGRSFVILDAGEQIGDSWRKRWDSLRLYSPAFKDGLPGMPFPARKTAYRRRMRWVATWRRTRRGSSSRCGAARPSKR